jgi:hypothetical protein
MALVESRTDHRVGTTACAHLTGVGLGTEVTVVAGSSISYLWIRAQTGSGVAETWEVTLVESGAEDGIPSVTHAFLAHVDLRAEIAVVAGCSIG